MSEVRKKILCIEDDRETAKLIAKELSQRGFYALIAYDGRVGLTAILKRIPDLVLCDVGLPDISGFELLASLNELVPQASRVPFVFLTGLSGRYDELQGRSLGADDYVTKPIDFDILETIVRARLFRGVARHEIPANLPKLNGDRFGARPRGPRGKACARAAMREKIVELIDAPTVGCHLDNAESAPGTSARIEDTAKAATGRIIKR